MLGSGTGHFLAYSRAHLAPIDTRRLIRRRRRFAWVEGRPCLYIASRNLVYCMCTCMCMHSYILSTDSQAWDAPSPRAFAAR